MSVGRHQLQKARDNSHRLPYLAECLPRDTEPVPGARGPVSVGEPTRPLLTGPFTGVLVTIATASSSQEMWGKQKRGVLGHIGKRGQRDCPNNTWLKNVPRERLPKGCGFQSPPCVVVAGHPPTSSEANPGKPCITETASKGRGHGQGGWGRRKEKRKDPRP